MPSPETPSSGVPFGDLPVGERRRVIARAVSGSLGIVVLLVVGYYLAPVDGAAGAGVAVRVTFALAALALSIALGAVVIVRARYPLLGLLYALSAVVGSAVVLFAGTHLIISQYDPSAFSEPLNHTGALYFTVVTATTIGYGDISPQSDLARIVVMLHMVVNVAILGVGVRALVGVARQRRGAG